MLRSGREASGFYGAIQLDADAADANSVKDS